MTCRPGAIQRIGVAIPAQDEEGLLPECLAALARAAERSPVPVSVVVVADAWLTRQLELAEAGADAIAGTVRVDKWTGHPRRSRRRYARLYINADGHSHVHGANLAVSAAAYLAVGGVPALPVQEDVALIAALDSGGFRVARSGRLAVRISARPIGRTPARFAGYLRSLAVEGSGQPG